MAGPTPRATSATTASPADGSPDVISLGNGTSDGSYTRFQALGPIRQAVETDVLRGIENVTGSDSDEVINGNDGANVLDGRGGNDIIDGGLGNERSSVGMAGSTRRATSAMTAGGSQRHHYARARRRRWKLRQNGGNGPGDVAGRRDGRAARHRERDRFQPEREIIGNERDNVIDGRGGEDNIDGGLGNDVIIGGAGIDLVF